MFRDAVEPELALLRILLRQGDVMVDVGACVGTYSVLSAQLVGETGAVVSVDPNPVSLAVLRENARHNGLANVASFCLAASSELGVQSFSSEDARPDTRHLLSEVSDQLVASMNQLVPTVTLDWLVESCLPDRKVRLIKIDAEGAEPLVLAGAVRTIARCSPVIFVETAVTESAVPDQYVRLGRPMSRNHILIHESDGASIDAIVAANLGFMIDASMEEPSTNLPANTQ